MYYKTKLKLGFSILELIVVMAILGILMLTAIPMFQDFVKDAKDVTRAANFHEMGKAADTSVLTYMRDGGVMRLPYIEGYNGNIYNITGDFGNLDVGGIKGQYTDFLLEYSDILPTGVDIHIGGLEYNNITNVDNIISIRDLKFAGEEFEYFTLTHYSRPGFNPINVAGRDLYYKYLYEDNNPNTYALTLVFDDDRSLLATVLLNDGYISVNGKNPTKAIVGN